MACFVVSSPSTTPLEKLLSGLAIVESSSAGPIQGLIHLGDNGRRSRNVQRALEILADLSK